MCSAVSPLAQADMRMSSALRIRYRVREGAEEAFDQWLQQMSWYEMNARGNTGVAIQRRLYGNELTYYQTSTFTSEASRDRWLHSEQREYCLSRLLGLLSEPPQIDYVAGASSELTGSAPPDLFYAHSSRPPLLAKLALVSLVLLV